MLANDLYMSYVEIFEIIFIIYVPDRDLPIGYIIYYLNIYIIDKS